MKKVGLALFEHVAACHKAGIDPESALSENLLVRRLKDSKIPNWVRG